MKKNFRRNKQFKIVKERKDCDSILYFYHQIPIVTSFIIDNKSVDLPFDERFTYFFVKNKNPHDGKRCSRSFIKDEVDPKGFLKKNFN